MKKNEEPFQMKGKGMAAAIAICFIAVVALVGAYTFSSYKREMKEQLAKAEEEQKEKEREAEEKSSRKPPTQIESYFQSRKKQRKIPTEKNNRKKEKPRNMRRKLRHRRMQGQSRRQLQEQQLISVRKTPFCGR